MPTSQPRRWPVALVRVLALITLLQVLLQAALAGGFISGHVGYLTAHSVNGSLLVLTVMALGVATILLFRPGRGPWWPILLSAVLWWMVAVQVGVGFARLVGLHIPLGASILALTGAFAWWSFSYRPRPVTA
ncbi:hypothetical protein Aph02nite_83160 [Actinoplanes philippinensis]|uniref:Integral membrane protein n=1 Tax=Actinoplanes philippinensis TaxID=35752 RepID=A0A1I2LAF7_9ACTN|nr:hypothetical protein [Actinoplanes philippinensis]GIE82366.1 hypothetical protein Aph02nite_83160 [Actinoplanes philippinensis]SFF75460.1 hypothetical protein SAMN05421541_120126 [Actinoplanes philippinensis]